MLKTRFGICFTAALIAMLALTGCGGDDGPSNPGSQFDTFTEDAAVVQAQTSAPQAVAMVSQITSISSGFSKKGTPYSWNQNTERWEWAYTGSDEEFEFDLFYTVQYLAGSTPQQGINGADTVHHTMHGTRNLDDTSEDYHIVFNYLYDYDTTITGIGTDTRTMMGSGQHEVSYAYTGEGGSQSATYAASWEILGAGIQSGVGGCAVGTIRYHFGTFYTDVVFNGSGTATYTTYNGSGEVVAGGGGTASTFCQN